MSVQVLTQSIGSMVFPRINLRKIWLLGFILIVSLLIFYIFQISEIARVSFAISAHEQEAAKLFQQNKNLEISLFQRNSLFSLETMVNELNYEKVNKINYIRFINSQVAAKP